MENCTGPDNCSGVPFQQSYNFYQGTIDALNFFKSAANPGKGHVDLERIGVAGHSLGEFAALVAADVLALTAAIEIVVVRGRAMQAAVPVGAGAMAALLGVGTDVAGALCDEARGGDVLLVANENSPQQVVISGSVAAVERAEALAAEWRIRAVRLRVAGAFHSPLMEPAVEPLEAAIDAFAFATPRMPVASNVTGAIVTDAEEIRSLLKRHVVSPVRWERCARALREAGAETFVEAGPGDVLTKMAGHDPVSLDALCARSGHAAATLRTVLLELELAGHVARLPGGLFQRVAQA